MNNFVISIQNFMNTQQNLRNNSTASERLHCVITPQKVHRQGFPSQSGLARYEAKLNVQLILCF